MLDEPRDPLRALSADYFHAPSFARIWDYWLGGKENYKVDRAASDAIALLNPDVFAIARNTRQMLVRVVHFLAGEAGIRQILDIGPGLPTPQNTHEVAQSVAPDSKIIYVDNDPLVMAHARALLTNTTPEGVTTYMHADVRNPSQIITEARNVLDFTKPIAIMLLGVLGHACNSFEHNRSIINTFIDALPPGSYLAYNEGVDLLGDKERVARVRHYGYALRTVDEFHACVAGLELVDPGVVPVNRWRPVPVEVGVDAPLSAYVAVGRKPDTPRT